MTTRYFQLAVSNPTNIYPKNKLDSAVTTAYNGYVMKQDSDGDLTPVTGINDAVVGLLYEPGLINAELPASDNVATYYAGKRVGMLQGRFTAMVGMGLFNGTLVPSIGDYIFSYGNGKFDNTWRGGTLSPNYLGKVRSTESLQGSDSPDLLPVGTTYESVVVVDFDIPLY
ncbi:MAG: hypothetical protein WC822_06095 [Candidatus Paceibacterota bacterium]|jgi:hypothetical protein